VRAFVAVRGHPVHAVHAVAWLGPHQVSRLGVSRPLCEQQRAGGSCLRGVPPVPRRLEGFLNDGRTAAVPGTAPTEPPSDGADAVVLSNCTLSWFGEAPTREPATSKPTATAPADAPPATPAPSREPCIAGLSLTVGRGRLVCVVGAVGAGKSSLLSALAGELKYVVPERGAGS
jgi:hypothetical protein